MIVYSKAFWQLPLALHFGRGSPLTRNLLLPVLSCCVTVLLYLFTCKHVVAPLGTAEGEDGEEGLNTAQCTVKWVRDANMLHRPLSSALSHSSLRLSFSIRFLTSCTPHSSLSS